MNLIAEHEGIRPRQQKKWDMFLGEFGSIAFAIAPLYSTFLHQKDYVSCHLACLVMLQCLLSRCVGHGENWLARGRGGGGGVRTPQSGGGGDFPSYLIPQNDQRIVGIILSHKCCGT